MTEWRYADRILQIDLSAAAAWAEPTSLELKREFIGGAGFVAHLLSATGDAGHEKIQVAMAAGPLSDAMAGRLAMGATPGPNGRPALSSMGGRLAGALKQTGFDAMVLKGRLERPGCLVVEDGDVRVLPADDLWGLDVPATEAALRTRHGKEYAALVVGPAAENQVAFATLAHEGHYAGGSGVAAILGAQRLKAILFRETEGLPTRCEGCSLNCPLSSGPDASTAGVLGLDAPTAGRLAALARNCASAGLLPMVAEPLEAIARRQGIGGLLAEGEQAVLSRLGPKALQVTANLPKGRKRHLPVVADLLGTCTRVFRERPGQVLRGALSHTHGLLTAWH